MYPSEHNVVYAPHTTGASDGHTLAWLVYITRITGSSMEQQQRSLIAPDNIKVGAAGDGWEDDAVNPGNDVTGTAVTAWQELVYTAPTGQWLNFDFKSFKHKLWSARCFLNHQNFK